jgi:hypothetical protein
LIKNHLSPCGKKFAGKRIFDNAFGIGFPKGKMPVQNAQAQRSRVRGGENPWIPACAGMTVTRKKVLAGVT